MKNMKVLGYSRAKFAPPVGVHNFSYAIHAQSDTTEVVNSNKKRKKLDASRFFIDKKRS